MKKGAGNLRVARPDATLHRMMGHFRTIAPTVRETLVSRPCPSAERWQDQIPNEVGEPIMRSGLFTDVAGRDEVVVVLHGLGGTVDRGYCVAAARAAEKAGLPCFRLALRGADGVGRDLHHAGFTADLGPILSRPPLDRFDKIALVGYSLGGHVALSAAMDEVDERLSAVVALCPPLNLKACQQEIDAPNTWLYRQYLLRALKDSYPSIARGSQVKVPIDRITSVKTLREWDALTVVPRFGFDDVDHYYQTQSVGPRLEAMKLPALVICSPADPMIPADSLRGPLGRASQEVVVRWVHGGGHVFFPPKIDLGFGAHAGVENQVMQWLANKFE